MKGILLLSILSLACGACRTDIALVDREFGFERSHAGRSVHLLSTRAALRSIATIPAAELDDLARHDGVGLAARFATPDTDTLHVCRFSLDLQLENRSDSAWTLTAGDLVLAVEKEALPETAPDAPDWECTLCTPQVERVLTTVAACSTARYRLPIHIAVPADAGIAGVERFALELRARHDAQHLLHKRIVIGSFSQVGQFARVALMLTGGLLVLSALI